MTTHAYPQVGLGFWLKWVLADVIGGTFGFIFLGIPLGLMQAIILEQQNDPSDRWFKATIIGWIMGFGMVLAIYRGYFALRLAAWLKTASRWTLRRELHLDL